MFLPCSTGEPGVHRRKRNLNYSSQQPEVWKGAHAAAVISLQEACRALILSSSPMSWHGPAQGLQLLHGLSPTEQRWASLTPDLPFLQPADWIQSQAGHGEHMSILNSRIRFCCSPVCQQFKPIFAGVSWSGGCEPGISFFQLWQRGCKLLWERKKVANGAVTL